MPGAPHGIMVEAQQLWEEAQYWVFLEPHIPGSGAGRLYEPQVH